MDPFKSAQSKVLDLQEQASRLERSIPKLQEIEKQLNENVGTLRKAEVASITKLENVKSEIARRTTAFNQWMSGEQEALLIEKNKLEKQVKEFQIAQEAEVAKRKQAHKEFEARQKALDKLIDEIAAQRTEINGQAATNNQWSIKLAEQEKIVKQVSADNTRRSQELDTKEQTLAKRESDIANRERLALDAQKTAEVERDSAHTLLEDAKDKIAINDTREKELDGREAISLAKEKDLDKLAIRLNDRRAVIEANANL